MMGAALARSYTLKTNIDLSSNLTNFSDIWGTNYNNVTPGKGFVPVGNNTYNFAGLFYGSGYTISHLYINNAASSYAGLFGYVKSNATIYQPKLTSVYVLGNQYVGGVAGYNTGSIYNAYVSGAGGVPVWASGPIDYSNIQIDSAAGTAGGIAGYNSGYIENAINSTANVGSAGNLVGGIVGSNAGVLINAANNGAYTGTTNNSLYQGGLVGLNSATATILNSTSSGSLLFGYYGGNYGGLVGSNAGIISRSYSTGTVMGGYISSYIGGLVGYNDTTGNINNSYTFSNNLNDASSGSYTGGAIGANAGTVNNVFAAGYMFDTNNNYSGGFVGSNTGTITIAFGILVPLVIQKAISPTRAPLPI